jgi:poly-gamma-glutamate capsule biosynthesis protein CapA/YwtB (metallophosphatase superfamily)
MAGRDKPGTRRLGGTTLAILGAFVFVTAVVAVSIYLAGIGSNTSASKVGSERPDTTSAQVLTSISTTRASGAQSDHPGQSSPVTTDSRAASASTTSSASSTTSSTQQTTTTTAPPPILTVAAGGDVLGDRGVGRFIDAKGGAPVFAAVEPLLKTADVAFVNLECPISDKGNRNPTKEYTFRGRPALVEGLNSGGIDVVSLANNHTLDYGKAALLDTVARLDDAGVGHAGAGANVSEAEKPAMLRTSAGSVAVLAFTEIIPGGFAATSKQAGVNAVLPNHKKVVAAIATAAEKADFVIVSFHWGTEYTSEPTQEQRLLAHQAIDAGADLVIGHHPHVIQGMELYHDKLIAYSMGDFVFDHYSRETGEAFVLRVALSPAGALSLEATPVYLDESTGVPAPVSGAEADRILDRLGALSARLGLELTRFHDQVVFEVAPPLTP